MTEVDQLIPGHNDLLIRIHKTAICGTDMHIYHWDEWSQATILEVVACYTPEDRTETFDIMNALEDRLQHANSAVVMSAVKVILGYMGLITNQDSLRALSRKLAPPLVTQTEDIDKMVDGLERALDEVHTALRA